MSNVSETARKLRDENHSYGCSSTEPPYKADCDCAVGKLSQEAAVLLEQQEARVAELTAERTGMLAQIYATPNQSWRELAEELKSKLSAAEGAMPEEPAPLTMPITDQKIVTDRVVWINYGRALRSRCVSLQATVDELGRGVK